MTEKKLNITREQAQQATLHLAKLDYATEIAELAGTSVVVQADAARSILDYVEALVAFYNSVTVGPDPGPDETGFTDYQRRKAAWSDLHDQLYGDNDN